MVQMKQPASTGTNSLTSYMHCVVTDVDLVNMVAHVTDQLGGKRVINLSRFLNKPVAYPVVGEQWIITSQYGDWIFAVSVNTGLVTGPIGPQGPQGLPYNNPAVNMFSDFSFDNWAPAGTLSNWSTFWTTGATHPVVTRTIGSPNAYDANGVEIAFQAATSSQRIEANDVFAVVPGQRYLISFWAKGTGTAPQIDITALYAASGVPDFFGSGVTSTAILTPTSVTSTWTLYSTLWTVPTGAGVVRMVFSAYGGLGDIVYMDRTTFRIADVPNSFNGVPAGGASGAVLSKNSGTDFDEVWLASTSAATASANMVRDASGRAQVVDPAVAADIATKNYTDTRITDRIAHAGFAGTDPADGKWHYVGMWGEPAFQNGTAYDGSGASFSPPRFKKDPEGCVWIVGLGLAITSGSTPIFTLPAGYRPGYTLVFSVASGNPSTSAPSQIKIDTSGNVTLLTGGTGYTSFDGVTFMAEDYNAPTWLTPTLTNSWVNYGAGYAPARYYQDSCGDVHLSGMVMSGTSAGIFTLPSGYYPTDQPLMFAQTSVSGTARVDTQTNGVVNLTGYGAGASNSWVSLEGIVIPNIGGVWPTIPATLQNSWVNWGAGWSAPSICYNKNGVVSIRGLIKSGTTTSPTTLYAAGTFGPNWAPTFEKIFLVGASLNVSGRFDVLKDGSVQFVSFFNSGTNGYLATQGRYYIDHK